MRTLYKYVLILSPMVAQAQATFDPASLPKMECAISIEKYKTKLGSDEILYLSREAHAQIVQPTFHSNPPYTESMVPNPYKKFRDATDVSLVLDISWYPSGMMNDGEEELVINNFWLIKDKKGKTRSLMFQARPKGPFKDLKKDIRSFGGTYTENEPNSSVYKSIAVTCGPKK